MDICLARQPILDRFRRTHAYELLFRDGLTGAFSAEDPDRASPRVLDISSFAFGVETLTGGRPAFVNFTREALIGRHEGADPGNLLVLEIREHAPDPEVLRGCRALKTAGFTIALDDVVTATLPPELVALADIAKVDFSKTSAFTRHHIARTLRRPAMKMLAEKVETEKEFRQALDSGYGYFQGYFFARPGIVAGRAIPASKLNILNLIREAHRPDAPHARVEGHHQARGFPRPQTPHPPRRGSGEPPAAGRVGARRHAPPGRAGTPEVVLCDRRGRPRQRSSQRAAGGLGRSRQLL